MNYLLPLLVVLPIAGAIVAAVLPRASTAKGWALGVAIATAVLAVLVGLRVPYTGAGGLVLEPSATWTDLGPVRLRLGIDGISLFLVLLTAVMVPLAIASTTGGATPGKDRPRQFYAWMLALLGFMLGVFLARDLLLFYAFFELTLVPSFFLIGVWGGPERREAAGKFFLYTFAASVFTLAAIIYVGAKAGSFAMADAVHYAQHNLSRPEQMMVAIGLLSAFVVKAAVFPLHTWLPLAYTEAPTPVTVILASVMPKLGTYGLLRLALPMGLVYNGYVDPAHASSAHPQLLPTGLATPFPALSIIVGVGCVAGILYGALIAWVQRDMKRLLAYSSFSHLGLCVLGLMAVNQVGAQGSLLYMVNHGLSTGALFLMVGMIFDRFGTHDRDALGGLAKSMPKLAFFLVLFAMSSIGLPGLNGFASEFLTLQGTFGVSSPAGTIPGTSQLGPWFGAVAALGMILSAVYMLAMVNGLLFGPAKTPSGKGGARDLNGREIAILAPLAVLVVVLGVVPTSLLRRAEGPIQNILMPTPVTDSNPMVAAPPTLPATALVAVDVARHG
jgi:NADH-quinone oxidoreductase subunit M